MVVIPRQDSCCKEDVITSDYEGSFVDVGVDERDMVEDEEEEELVI